MGRVSARLRLPKARAVAANSSAVAMTKPAVFSSASCAARPPMIQAMGAGSWAGRSAGASRNAATTVQADSASSAQAIQRGTSAGPTPE